MLDAEPKLREASQLHALGQRLPHLATEHERELLAEFSDFVSSVRSTCSLAAINAGFAKAWRERDYARIHIAGCALSDLRDRDLQTYALLAMEILRRDPMAGVASLLEVWDPVGTPGGLRGTCAPHIVELASRGASVAELVVALERDLVDMGRTPVPGRELRCARAIAALFEPPSG